MKGRRTLRSWSKALVLAITLTAAIPAIANGLPSSESDLRDHAVEDPLERAMLDALGDPALLREIAAARRLQIEFIAGYGERESLPEDPYSGLSISKALRQWLAKNAPPDARTLFPSVEALAALRQRVETVTTAVQLEELATSIVLFDLGAQAITMITQETDLRDLLDAHQGIADSPIAGLVATRIEFQVENALAVLERVNWDSEAFLASKMLLALKQADAREAVLRQLDDAILVNLCGTGSPFSPTDQAMALRILEERDRSIQWTLERGNALRFAAWQLLLLGDQETGRHDLPQELYVFLRDASWSALDNDRVPQPDEILLAEIQRDPKMVRRLILENISTASEYRKNWVASVLPEVEADDDFLMEALSRVDPENGLDIASLILQRAETPELALGWLQSLSDADLANVVANKDLLPVPVAALARNLMQERSAQDLGHSTTEK